MHSAICCESNIIMNVPHIPLEELVNRFTSSVYDNTTLQHIERWMHYNLNKDNAQLILHGLKRVFSTFFVRSVERCKAYMHQELAVLASLLAAFMDCKVWTGFHPSSREAAWCELTLGGISIYLIDVLLQTTAINNASSFAQAVYRRIFLLPKSHFKAPTNALRLIALYKWASADNESFTLTSKDLIENYLDAQSLVTWIEKRSDKMNEALDLGDSPAEKVLESTISSCKLEDFVVLLEPTVKQTVEEEEKKRKKKQTKRLKSIKEDRSSEFGTTSKKRKKLAMDSERCLKKKRKTKDLSCNDAYSVETLERTETSMLTRSVLQDSNHEDQVENQDLDLVPPDGPNIPEHFELPSPQSTPDMGQASMSADYDSRLVHSEPSSINSTVSPNLHFTPSVAASSQLYSSQAQTVVTNGSGRVSMTPQQTALSQPENSHLVHFDKFPPKEENASRKTSPEALQKCSQNELQVTLPSSDIISDYKCYTGGPASPKITNVVETYQTGALLSTLNENGMRIGLFSIPDQNTPPGGAQENCTHTRFLHQSPPKQGQVSSDVDSSNVTPGKVTATEQLKPPASGATRQLLGKSPTAHDPTIDLAKSPMNSRQSLLRGQNSPVSVESTPEKAPHTGAETDSDSMHKLSSTDQKISRSVTELSSPLKIFKLSTPPTPVLRQSLSRPTQSKGVLSGSSSPTIGTRKSTVRRQNRSDKAQILNELQVSDLMTSLQDAEVSKSPVTTPIKRLSTSPLTIDTSLLCGKLPSGGPVQNLTSVLFNVDKNTDVIDEVSVDSVHGVDASGLLTAVPIINASSSRTPRSNRRKLAAQETSLEKRRVSLRRRDSASIGLRTNDSSAEPTDKKERALHQSTPSENAGSADLDKESNQLGSVKSVNRQKHSGTSSSVDILPVPRESPVTHKSLSRRRRSQDSGSVKQALTNTPLKRSSVKLGRSTSAKKEETTPRRQPYLLRTRT